ncbi:hypothetical protein MTR_4g122040 [Medicago truncatula]|uniref:DYW domain-containing protein n=1 Tax=Medicago truncatula TaxID=3880 RepID=G7JNW0_MEDTR|nr:hypothetical protein MTR_4g122040 [Medicago truncatula]
MLDPIWRTAGRGSLIQVPSFRLSRPMQPPDEGCGGHHEKIARDRNHFHHFKDGFCSCNDKEMQLEGVVKAGMAVAIVATTTLAPAITPSVYTRIGDGAVWIT